VEIKSGKGAAWRLLVVALTIAAVAIAGCGGGDDDEPSASTTTAGKRLQEIDFLLSFPMSIYWLPLMIADTQGYFADEGLKLKFEETEGSGFVTQQIISGNFDFGSASAGDTMIAYSKDPDLRLLISPNARNIYQFVVREDSAIQSVDQLKGKKLGITEKGGGEGPIVDAALKDAGLTPGEDVRLLPVGGAGPQAKRAIETGQVDAYATSFPDIASLEADGLQLRDITPKKYSVVPGGGYLTRAEVLQDPEKRKVAVGIARAVSKGALWAEENPEAALKIACGIVPEECKDPAFAKAYLNATIDFVGFSNRKQDPSGAYGVVPLEGWETAAGLLTSSGTIDKDIDVETFVASPEILAIRKEYMDFDQAAVRKDAASAQAG
jgi:NitT/TauT family transport system substrate-binding protein